MTESKNPEGNEDNGDEVSGDMELREGLDYYLEDGLMVFTVEFLRRRGYCCERGCRHCPYTQTKEP